MKLMIVVVVLLLGVLMVLLGDFLSKLLSF